MELALIALVTTLWFVSGWLGHMNTRAYWIREYGDTAFPPSKIIIVFGACTLIASMTVCDGFNLKESK